MPLGDNAFLYSRSELQRPARELAEWLSTDQRNVFALVCKLSALHVEGQDVDFICKGDLMKVCELIQREISRLCRDGSSSLTFPGVSPGYPSMKLRSVSRQSTRIWSSIDGLA